jgi:hypothetical protein
VAWRAPARGHRKGFPIFIAKMMKKVGKQMQILIERMKVSEERYRLDDYIGLVLLL